MPVFYALIAMLAGPSITGLGLTALVHGRPGLRQLSVGAGVLVGYLTGFRILMVWVYERTRSLLLAMLVHASFTSSLLVLDPLGISGARLVVYSFSLAAVIRVVLGGIAIARRAGERGRPDPMAVPET